jgi:hypothetical protein
MLLPFSSYRLESTASSQRLVNCFAEKAPEGAKGPLVLRKAPGIAPHVTLTGGGRGIHTMNGVLYAIAGETLYSVTSGGVANSLGTVPGESLVLMSNNGTQLYMNSGHVYEGSVNAITDEDYTSGGAAAFLDQYIVITEPNSGRFKSSDLGDADSYDALYFATAEGAPDPLITLAVDHRQVVLIGTESTELWDNQGGSGFPFVRSPNGFIEIGGVALYGVTKQDQSVFWLANDRTVRRLNGNTAVRVSQHAFERRVREYGEVTDCQMFAYSLDGHLNAVVRFPGLATWVYDCTSGELHERQTYGYEDWDVCGFAEAYGKVFVQRASDGSVGVVTKDAWDEFGDTMVSSWTYQNVASPNPVTVDGLEMDVETGVGLTLGQGSDPRISLEVSYDGGRTYRQMPSRSMGLKGEYKHRVRWQRLGSGRDIVFRGSTADPVPFCMTNTTVVVR